MTTDAGTAPTVAGPTKATNIVLWVLAVLGTLSFLMAGGQKLSGATSMVQLFDAIGFGQWFRYLTGTLEVLGAIALVIPRLRALGALGLVGVMIGALITNFALHAPAAATASAAVELVIVAIVAIGRRRELTPAWVLRGERP